MSNYIAENPYSIDIESRPLIDNGFGKLVPDLNISPVKKTLGIARVARRRLPDVIVTNPKTPYDYQDVYYLLAPYDADWLHIGIVFEYFGEYFRTLRPENRIMFGEIVYKLCDLEQVTQADVGDFYGG